MLPIANLSQTMQTLSNQLSQTMQLITNLTEAIQKIEKQLATNNQILGNQATQLNQLKEIEKPNAAIQKLEKLLPKKYPFKIMLQEQIFTYRGLAGLLGMMRVISGATAWMLIQILPLLLLSRINNRANSIEIRLQKIEEKLQK